MASLAAAPADVLAFLVVLLEEVTVTAALASKGRDIGHRALRFVYGRDPQPSAESLEQRIERRSRELACLPKEQLHDLLRRVLRARSGSAVIGDTALSTAVVRSAARGYKISDDLTPAQQADAVANRFLEDFLAKQSPVHAQQTEHTLQAAIEAMSREQREEMRRALGVDELSGRTLRAMLARAGGPAVVMIAVQAAGFGAYIALTTIMSALFTSLLGVTLPFAVYTGAASGLSLLTGPFGLVILTGLILWGGYRSRSRIDASLFAIVIWCARLAAPPGALATPPSSASRRQLLGFDDVQAADQRAQQAEVRAAAVDEELRRATKRAEDLQVRVRIMEQDAAARDHLLGEMSSQLARLEDARKKLVKAQCELTAAQRRVEKAERRPIAEIEALWRVHLPRIRPELNFVRWVVRQRLENRVAIEEALRELQGSTDPAGLSRGKLQGAGGVDHLALTLPEGGAARIVYDCASGKIVVLGAYLKADEKSWFRGAKQRRGAGAYD